MIVLAVVAHPDDIEFMLAGTLLNLKAVGAEIHLINVADGSLGSSSLCPEEGVRGRWREAQESARIMGAQLHPPMFEDLGVFYIEDSLARMTSFVREIEPDVVLTQPQTDYMEDHQNTARLMVTAAFSRGIRFAKCKPGRAHFDKPIALYHSMPHGLRDQWGRRVAPERYIDVSGVMPTKIELLKCHRSQAQWLEDSQGMEAFETEMVEMAREVGAMSGSFRFAEGLIRHNPLGFSPAEFDPLQDLLGDICLRNESFANSEITTNQV